MAIEKQTLLEVYEDLLVLANDSDGINTGDITASINAEKAGGSGGLPFTQAIGVLIKSIKELSAKVTALENA